MKISYAVTVCNEHKELARLLDLLISSNERSGRKDEIIVQCDQYKTTDEVYKVLQERRLSITGKVIEYPLNNNFADFKNNLNSECTGDWIFQIDADEYPDKYLLDFLPSILKDNNRQVEAIWVPRINEVLGITQSHLGEWGWNMNDKGWVNFPDYQLRLYRNKKNIYWTKPVHEQLVGYKGFAKLPVNEEFCLWHPKDIDRQEIQNKFYEGL